ncbi:MAG TPA: hypothetical protein VFX97_03475 [Pyrinomonadaceae bacterium]|nr:hypothetical protein [Pyrinomonadaceae bacterium]
MECPFCNEWLTQVGAAKDPADSPDEHDAPDKPQSLAYLAGFANSSTWVDRCKLPLEWLRVHRPRTFSHWVTTISIAVGVFGILVGLGGPVAAVSQTLTEWLNSPPRIRAIECEHLVQQGQVVALRAQADDPDGGELRYRWLSSAGTINGDGANALLNTDGIIPKAISTDLTIELVVTDELGLTASRQERISVVSRNVLNNPPSLTVPPRCNCNNQQIRVGEIVSLYALAEASTTNAMLSYDWQSSSPALEIAKTNSDSGSTAILNTAGMGHIISPVPVKITLRVTDNHGGAVSGDLTIVVLPRQFSPATATRAPPEVKPNHSPKLEFFTADSLTVETGGQVKLWVFATDPDGDSPLYFDWKASAGEIIHKGDTAIFNSTGVEPGQKIINVTINDGRGGSTSQRLFVTVISSASEKASPSPLNPEG